MLAKLRILLWPFTHKDWKRVKDEGSLSGYLVRVAAYPRGTDALLSPTHSSIHTLVLLPQRALRTLACAMALSIRLSLLERCRADAGTSHSCIMAVPIGTVWH